MLKNGDFVKIRYSKELLMLDLCELVTRKAMVTKVTRKGAYVLPLSGKLGGEELYISMSAIESRDKTDKMRSKEIIKHTKL